MARPDLSGNSFGNKGSFVTLGFRKYLRKFAYASQKVAIALDRNKLSVGAHLLTSPLCGSWTVCDLPGGRRRHPQGRSQRAPLRGWCVGAQQAMEGERAAGGETGTHQQTRRASTSPRRQSGRTDCSHGHGRWAPQSCTGANYVCSAGRARGERTNQSAANAFHVRANAFHVYAAERPAHCAHAWIAAHGRTQWAGQRRRTMAAGVGPPRQRWPMDVRARCALPNH